MTRTTCRIAGSLVAALLGCVFAYGVAALALGLIAENRAFEPAADGVVVYLVSNGIHTDLVVPAGALATVRSGALRLADFGVRDPDAYLAVGWGDRDFYLTTPTWRELRAATAWHALSGSDATLLHVQPTSASLWGPGIYRLRVSRAALDRLAGYIDASFVIGTDGAAQRVAGAAYGANDAFYDAHGHYSLFLTCNEWTRRALSQAGIRSPVWSPFPWAIAYQLSGASEDARIASPP